MTKRGLWVASALLALAGLAFASAAATGEFFPLESVRPGIKGTGKTCFEGTKPEEFQVEILGVLHGVNPGSSVVLARFSGGRLDKTGIFEGMSGSPVFVDGKLLGAVAYSFAFAKEAIGGITPITQMVDAFSSAANLPAEIKIVRRKGDLWNYRLPLPVTVGKRTQPALVTNAIAQEPMPAVNGGHSLIPIATPLSMAGFSQKVLKEFAPQFRVLNMSILQGAGGAGPSPASSAQGPDNSPLEPGSNIVVSLVSGDLDVSAGGTVTYVDGNRLYAFGHSMFELGFTELPMYKAEAITVFPSLESSFKILEIRDPAGTIHQDRGMGIYGIVGEKPRMVPLRIHLTTSRGDRREFKYQLARDAFLTPILVNLTVYNTIVTSERAQGTVTLKVKGRINIKNEEAVEVDSRFSSDSDAPNLASLSVAAPINYLMAPGYKDLDLEDIEIEISAQESDKAAVLDSIRSDRSEVRAGELLDVEISSKKVDGEVIRKTYPVKVPANASPGELTMLVADGSSLMSIDEREEGQNLIPRDLTQLIRLINNLRKNDHLYVRFFRSQPGAVVKGEGLPGLPPSILSILRSDREAGAINMIRTVALMEYELPATDYMVMGMKTLKLMVKP